MRPLLALLLSASVLAGCQDECNREGCDALTAHASSASAPGVAGVIASESDVVANDCQECGFAAADIDAWGVDREVQTEADVEAALIPPAVGIARAESDGKYSLALPAGHYVVCVNQSCFNVEVGDGTTTLNVKLINGVSRGFVGKQGEALRGVDGIFRPPGIVGK